MRLSPLALVSLTLTSTAAIAAPAGPAPPAGDMALGEVNSQRLPDSDAQVKRRDAIRAAFLANYEAYEKLASPSDVLNPLNQTGRNTSTLAGWGGSIVNSLSTMIVMGLETTETYERALAHTKSIDFAVASNGERNSSLRIFVSTIRYIGGMLSAYQLMGEKQEHRFLVDQAKVLADRLSRGWYNGHRLPNNRLLYNQGIPEDINDAVTIASAGTISLEWSLLSDYTANDTYRKLTNDAVNAIIETNATLLPGLPTSWLGIANETGRGDLYVTLGAGGDSYFETLIKYGQLWGESTQDKRISAWSQAVNSSVHNLIVKSGAGNLTFLSDYTGGDNVYRVSQLASQAGGNWALGGRLLKRDDWVQHGLELTESSWRVGNSTATGLVPETWGYFDAEGRAKGWGETVAFQRAFFDKHGYFIDDPSNAQRNEVIQNLFYAWRITRAECWRDMAWSSFLAMKKHFGTESGAWAGLANVDDVSSEQTDETSASTFSELFKYLYLSEQSQPVRYLELCDSHFPRTTVFDDSSNYSLDDYVYTTEGHLFKVAKRNPDFGTVQGSFNYQPLSTGFVPTSIGTDKATA